jgi:hypothetical protein
MYPRLVLFITAFLVAFNLSAAQLGTQKSSANGVTVAVTPRNLAADAKTWEFAVVLDTHTQELSDDLARSALLVDDRGNEFKALAWEGAAPGGHHRKGVLRFNAIEPKPQTLELRISRKGEAKARIFRWSLR